MPSVEIVTVTEDPFREGKGTSVQPEVHKTSTSVRHRKTVVPDDTNLMYNSENNHDFPDGGKDAYFTLVGSFVGLIIDFGIANSLGAIESYVTSHQLQNVKQTSVAWVFTLHLSVMFFGAVIFGELFDKFGTRKLLFASTVLTCVGLICTAESTELYHYILSFGIVTALGTSIGMVPLIAVLSHWFLKKRAFACSVATSGGLIGSAIFSIMLQKLYGQVGFKWAMRILALISLVCMSVSIVLIREREVQKTNEYELESLGERGESGGSENEYGDRNEYDRNGYGDREVEETPTHKQNILSIVIDFFKGVLDFSIVKDKRFIFLVIGVCFTELLIVSSLTYLASYGLDHGLSDYHSYMLITSVNIAGIPSRLLTGVLADKYGRFNVMIISAMLTTIAIFGLWLPAGDNTTILFVFAVIYGIATSSAVSLIPATASQICSADKFGKVYGMVYFFLAFVTVLGMYLVSLLLGNRTREDYRNYVLFNGCVAAVSVVSWIAARYSVVGWKWVKF